MLVTSSIHHLMTSLYMRCVLIVIVVTWYRTHRSDDSVTIITPTPSTSSSNLAEQEYIYTNEVQTTSAIKQVGEAFHYLDNGSSDHSGSPTYDDVYVPQKQSDSHREND